MYTIHTPNKDYDGDWYGVTFHNGLGHTADPAVADAAQKLGYTVTSNKPPKTTDTPTEAPETPVQAPKKRAPRKKASA